MNVTTFRTNFPEFSDPLTYPDSIINFWLGVGGKMLNACRWGNMLDEGLQLFTAHNISLEARSIKNASIGGDPGAITGAVTGKTVDKVSISYDSSAAMAAGAGHWNLTSYGLRFRSLSRIIGAGGIQVTGDYTEIAPGGVPVFPWSPT